MADDPQEIGGGGGSIDVGSMVSHRDGKGYVELRWGLQHAQLPLEDARQLAAQLQETANAAEADAFLVAFLKHADLPEQVWGTMLVQFRRYRDGEPFDERKARDDA